MKKYLRGKRYIRSRASVIVGRFGKQMRKLNRLVDAMKTMTEIMKSPNFLDGMVKAIQNIEQATRKILLHKLINLGKWN